MPQQRRVVVLGTGQGQSGSTRVAVPSLIGEDIAVAEDRLRILEFEPKVERVRTIGTQGEVVRQNPAPFTERPQGSTVTLGFIDNPVSRPDVFARFDQLDAAVATLETDEAAATRNESVLEKLDVVIDKLDDYLGGTPTSSS